MAPPHCPGYPARCTHPTIHCIVAGGLLEVSRIRLMPTSNSRAYKWLWIAGLWASLGILDATQNIFAMRYAGMHHAWGKLFLIMTVGWLPWALATPWVIQLGRRYPVAWRSPLVWLIHLGAVLVINLATAAWITALQVQLQPWLPDFATNPFLASWPMKFFGGFVPALILYGTILAVTYVLDSKARTTAERTDTARLNEQLSYARLNALQRQIEPHFIFNTLNAISGLVREQKNDAAVNMIVALSDFLRRVAASSNDARVPLAQETEFLEKYLQIQQARFAGRLKLDLQIPDDVRKAQIPNLILQPLVENAIKHGIAKQVQGGVVRVTASRLNGTLHLSVYNDGPPLDREEGATKNGIGLANLRTRLSLLYGGDFTLQLENRGGTGVQALVALPYSET
jgi:two-component system LytT family sensor kinase